MLKFCLHTLLTALTAFALGACAQRKDPASLTPDQTAQSPHQPSSGAEAPSSSSPQEPSVPPGQTAEPPSPAPSCAISFDPFKGCVSWSWETEPTEEDFGSFLFQISTTKTDGSQTLVDPDGSVVVTLWMPGMGHGSSPVHVERLGVGLYRASKVFFTMPGRWDIRIQIKEGGTVRDQAVITIAR